jgi:hypothetical protein
MKKLLLTFTLLLCLTSIFAKSDFNSSIDLSLFYHPSFDLSEDAELPMRSSIGTRWILTPISYRINKVSLSFNTGIMFVSDSLTYNNSKMRGYSAFDLDLGLDYKFNDLLSTKLTVGAGKLQLGEEDLVEAYLLGTLTPSFNIYKRPGIKIDMTTPFNFIYRKQLITTTVGIGIKIDFTWREKYIES